ncbi:hypothetical protein FUSNEC_GEN_294_05205 [Fusobacterium necrophorum subsp. funduliforme]|uniref:hypothetical protein n=1 Tax=Fusobacterium necrophorum TaxID=859 RepID=UPI00370EB863
MLKTKGTIILHKEFIKKILLNSVTEYTLFLKYFRVIFPFKIQVKVPFDKFNRETIVLSFSKMNCAPFELFLINLSEKIISMFPTDECLINEEKTKTNELLLRWKQERTAIKFHFYEMNDIDLLTENVIEIRPLQVICSPKKRIEFTKQNIVKLGLDEEENCVDLSQITFSDFSKDLVRLGLTVYLQNTNIDLLKLYNFIIPKFDYLKYLTIFDYSRILKDQIEAYKIKM